MAYIDCIFLLNAAMDYLLCLITARLAGISLKRSRYIWAALVGGIYAVAVFLPGGTYLSIPLLKIAVGVLLPLIAYGGEKKLFRLMLLFWLLSCVIAGSVLGLSLLLRTSNSRFHANPNVTILIFASLGIYLILKLTFRSEIQNGLQGKLLPVRICISGKTGSITALWDTGNQLQDPVCGTPVLVVAPERIDHILPKELQNLFKQDPSDGLLEQLESIQTSVPALKPRLLPYQSVGSSSGVLLVIRTDWIEICGVLHRNAWIAFAPAALGRGYDALWGGDVKRGGNKDEYSNPNFLLPKKEVGYETGHLLHWRQRHASSSADEGAGNCLTGSD